MKTGTVDFDFFDLDLYEINKGPEMVKRARRAEAEEAAAKRLDLDYMLDAINRNALQGMENGMVQEAVAAAPAKRKRRFDVLPGLITSLEWAISVGVVVLAVMIVTTWCV